jgi:hypothetical protein
VGEGALSPVKRQRVPPPFSIREASYLHPTPKMGCGLRLAAGLVVFLQVRVCQRKRNDASASRTTDDRRPSPLSPLPQTKPKTKPKNHRPPPPSPSSS